MSRKWLLFLFCLAGLISLAPLSSASLTTRVNESACKIRFQRHSTEVSVVIESSLRNTVEQRVTIELLDPLNRIVARADRSATIARGSQTLQFTLPFDVSKLTPRERARLLWYRLRYQTTETTAGHEVVAEGMLSVSEIAPDIFELRVAAAEMAHEAMRYRARVQAIHPVTKKGLAAVNVQALLNLETDDNGGGVKLTAAGTTDDKGYAILFFDIPPRFPAFPHELRPAGGTIKVTAERNGFVAEAENDVLVDQFARLLVSTDKPLYQPGQVLHMRAVALSPTRKAIANQEVIFRVEDPENTQAFREVGKSSRFGVASVDWPIPANARFGDYWIKVALGAGEDSSQTSTKIRISRYDLPNFSVQAKPDRAYYLPNQNAEIKVTANYLFGQPVTHGHVRVVRETEREWNYREQKWDTEEGDEYEGDTDANGAFVAHVNLAEAHDDLKDNEYRQFRDVNYAAYFTDPTTNRTEQRRFDVRVTKDPIHVYIINPEDSYRLNSDLPLGFYVSAFYADGQPCQCRLTIDSKKDEGDTSPAADKPHRLRTLNTNRFGLARVSGLRLPAELRNEDVEIQVTARDARGRRGRHEKEFDFDDDGDEIRIETDKSLYRSGEPITASISSNLANQTVVLDVGRDATVLSSQLVKLSGGRAVVTLPYQTEFKDRITIAAYPDFPDARSLVASRTVLYPRNRDLKIEAATVAKTFRPGDQAEVNFRVTTATGRVMSALGLTIFDKGVEERFRTDTEFGSNTYGFSRSFEGLVGSSEQIAGFSLRDLEHVDMSKPVPPDLDLVAEILLSQEWSYRPFFFAGDSYDQDTRNIFSDLTRAELGPSQHALSNNYGKTGEYPKTEAQLRSLLTQAGIDLQAVRDPWGTAYRPIFSIERQTDVLRFISAGPDKRFDTDDDFAIESGRWLYFRSVGEAIDRTVRSYHVSSGGFIRDLATLQAAADAEGVNPITLRDRWGQLYRFSFAVDQNRYLIKITSSGPDGKFSADQYYQGDDFVVWTSSIDYFSEIRARIDELLARQLNANHTFPQNERELNAALRDSLALESLRDPWGRPYYVTFNVQAFYTDRVRFENRGSVGEKPVQQMQVTPVTARASVINLRSMGADGKMGTPDDFTLGTFTGTVTEQTGGEPQPTTITYPVVFSGGDGAVAGQVKDPNGAAIAGATVSATCTTDSQKYETKTDEDGKYLFASLPACLYQLRFEATGFMPTIATNVLVRSSIVLEVNVEMPVGAATETVTVTAAAPGLQTTNASVSSSAVDFTIDGRQVKNLSRLKGVNFITQAGGSDLSTPRLREYFPETVVWQPSLETDKQGRAQLKFKLADNITTWKLSVIGSTEDGQIGTAEKEITAFQPFFVEHDPPRILTEGDQISLPVVVRNYLNRDQNVNLEIKPESWFTLLSSAKQDIRVSAGDSSRGIFEFRATASVTDAKQRITALAGEANDAIEKPVAVHPDGEQKSVTASDIVSETGSVKLDIPASAIPKSTQAELKIYPNLLAHVAESVEAIMSRPYGCGEQTISSTYPSLLLFRNYKQTGHDSVLRGQAEKYLNAGYARLLNYRAESGGFTYWGHGDPDLALTAYALQFLSQARDVITIDDNVIKQAREWLIKQQRVDGSWVAYEYDFKHENKVRTAMVTAYIARVLAMTAPKSASDAKAPTPVELQQAFSYLAARADEIDEPYLLASYALARLEVGDVQGAGKLIDKLQTLAHEERGATYWSLETNTPFYGWGLAGRIETTALVVQALSRYESARGTTAASPTSPQINSGLLFLLREKDRYGVWYSTQASINVLNALLDVFGREPGSSAAPRAAAIQVNGREVKSIELPDPRRLVNPITVDLTQFMQSGVNQIELRRAPGSTPASMQAVTTFYVPWKDSVATQEANWRSNGASGLRLVTRFDKTEGHVSDQIQCHVEAERIGFRGYGMMLAEIGLPPGADVDRASLEAAMNGSDWSISQYDILPDRVVIYLWPRAGGTKFDFKFRPRFGLNAQTAASLVYDYYNPEARAIVAPTRFIVK